MEIIKNRKLEASPIIATHAISGITDISVLTIPPNCLIECKAKYWDVVINNSRQTAYIYVDGQSYEIINNSVSYVKLICLSSSTEPKDHMELTRIFYDCGFLTLNNQAIVIN